MVEKLVKKLSERGKYSKEMVRELISYLESQNLIDKEEVRKGVYDFAWRLYCKTADYELIKTFGVDALVSTLVGVVRDQQIFNPTEAKETAFVELIIESLPDPEVITDTFNELKEELLEEAPADYKEEIKTLEDLEDACRIADIVSELYYTSNGELSEAVSYLAKKLDGKVYRLDEVSDGSPEWMIVVERNANEFKTYPVYQGDEDMSGFWEAFYDMVVELLKDDMDS
jgi:uncharacterized protein YydD (DUF2326 family)